MVAERQNPGRTFKGRGTAGRRRRKRGIKKTGRTRLGVRSTPSLDLEIGRRIPLAHGPPPPGLLLVGCGMSASLPNWLSGVLALWLSGFLALWLSGFLALSLSGSLVVCFLVFWHSGICIGCPEANNQENISQTSAESSRHRLLRPSWRRAWGHTGLKDRSWRPSWGGLGARSWLREPNRSPQGDENNPQGPPLDPKFGAKMGPKLIPTI